MEQFPHLKFVQKRTGKPRYHGGGSKNLTSQKNREKRQEHSNFLQQSTNLIKSDWQNSITARKSQELVEIEENTAPIFLQINPELINAEFDLESFGIEIISEEDDGFIIGASFDNLKTLEDKIKGFISEEHGSGKIADFWKIIDGEREIWKPEHILSEYLFSQWDNIKDDEQYHVEVSVAFTKPIIKEPDPNKNGYENKIEESQKLHEERDLLLLERQIHFEEFVNFYGEIKSSIVELEDSFSCQILINGKGLKDLVVNYQYVFEVSEIEEISGIEGHEEGIPELEVKILPPEKIAIEVGVIDSGIMEGNKYIAPAIKKDNSISYIDGDSSTADHVKNGGHGTKVAGSILYPKGISEITSPYVLPCAIRNIRVLDKNNVLQDKYPASLMEVIVRENIDCKIFNLSITANSPCRSKHMSSWAAIIDKLIFEKDVLFLIATGNIGIKVIQEYINGGNNYPDYLNEKKCRLANPSQSCFALSVGSINLVSFEDENWNSLGGKNEISAFSRIGTGIWDTIKPDVVEYGGGLIASKNGHTRVRQSEQTSPELIRSTLHGGKAIGKDCVGTSFSAPKVAHIAAILKQIYPEEGNNLIRAFIVQGARLPDDHFQNPTKLNIQYFGYGIPSIDRVTQNSDHRITFYNTGSIKAEEGHLYSLTIPENLRDQGDEYDILIEVCLSFSANIRRTRQRTKSYLSTWLDWSSSKLNESFDEFAERSLVSEEQENEKTNNDSSEVIQWKIRERSDWGEIKDINRNNSSLQKDWAILKSYELPEELSFAVRGHKGWDKNKNKIPYAITVSLEILGTNIPIYETIKIENPIEVEV